MDSQFKNTQDAPKAIEKRLNLDPWMSDWSWQQTLGCGFSFFPITFDLRRIWGWMNYQWKRNWKIHKKLTLFARFDEDLTKISPFEIRSPYKNRPDLFSVITWVLQGILTSAIHQWNHNPKIHKMHTSHAIFRHHLQKLKKLTKFKKSTNGQSQRSHIS